MAFTRGQEVLILPSLKKWIEDQAYSNPKLWNHV
jgi:hypothetical protein